MYLVVGARVSVWLLEGIHKFVVGCVCLVASGTTFRTCTWERTRSHQSTLPSTTCPSIELLPVVLRGRVHPSTEPTSANQRCHRAFPSLAAVDAVCIWQTILEIHPGACTPQPPPRFPALFPLRCDTEDTGCWSVAVGSACRCTCVRTAEAPRGLALPYRSHSAPLRTRRRRRLARHPLIQRRLRVIHRPNEVPRPCHRVQHTRYMPRRSTASVCHSSSMESSYHVSMASPCHSSTVSPCPLEVSMSPLLPAILQRHHRSRTRPLTRRKRRQSGPPLKAVLGSIAQQGPTCLRPKTTEASRPAPTLRARIRAPCRLPPPQQILSLWLSLCLYLLLPQCGGARYHTIRAPLECCLRGLD
eukprot:m.940949 g.940949  ORF g.940949 m.940949 type:complete len:358 (+) comp23831_c0_seq2:1480-2553(+)